MKICLILASKKDGGGLEKHTIDLSMQLHRKGLDVSVIAHKKFKSFFENINFIPLDLSRGRNNIFILFKLYQILKKEQFDIIHTHASKATFMVAKIKNFINSKVVATLHSDKNNLSAFEKCDFVITVSEYIGRNLKTNNKATIYNGIQFPDKISKINLYDKYNIEKEKFIICSVGRLVKVKRFEIILEAIQKLNVHLILAGSGNEEDYLMKKVEQLKIEDKVTFIGSIENSKALQIINSSSLFVISSSKEGFPYTYVESMYCQTPLISTPVSDLPMFLGEKYIFPFDDVSRLSYLIEYIQKNYTQVLEDFKPKFNFAREKFSIETMVNDTIEIYNKVLKQ